MDLSGQRNACNDPSNPLDKLIFPASFHLSINSLLNNYEQQRESIRWIVTFIYIHTRFGQQLPFVNCMTLMNMRAHGRLACQLRRRRRWPRPSAGRAAVQDGTADVAAAAADVATSSCMQSAELAGAHPHGDPLAGRRQRHRRAPRVRVHHRAPRPPRRHVVLGRTAPHVFVLIEEEAM